MKVRTDSNSIQAPPRREISRDPSSKCAPQKYWSLAQKAVNSAEFELHTHSRLCGFRSPLSSSEQEMPSVAAHPQARMHFDFC